MLAVLVLTAVGAGCVNVPDRFTLLQPTSRPPAATATVGTVSPTPTDTATATASASETATPTPDFSELATPVPGTSVTFDLDADLTNPTAFYDLPYPSDLRRRLDGRPDLSGFPFPEGNQVMASVHSIADDRFGFPTLPVAYFRFDAPLREQHIDDVIPPAAGAPILLVDVDARSPERGRLFPIVATNPAPDPYVPEWLLAVGGVPGIILRPNRTYAFVVMRSLRDANGKLLGVPRAFAELRSEMRPSDARGLAAQLLYRSLWETLDDLRVPRADVAAATVFTTGDVVGDLAALSNRVVDRYDLAIDDLELVSIDGTQYSRFCELEGTVSMPQFQRGVPPFDTDGLFDFDSSGTPVLQREEVVPIVLTLPRAPMPEGGYPLMVYFHSSAGLSDEVVARGPVLTPEGTPTAGEGPAHVVAALGFAALGSALPLNPERYPQGGERAYVNLENLAAYRDTFRQGAIEQRLLIEAIGRLTISPAALADCPGPTLPPAETYFKLRPEPVSIFGQSMGAQYANMVGAIEPRVAAVVPTGSGGMWSLLLLQAQFLPGDATPVATVQALLGTTAPLTHLHPGLQLLESAWEAADPIAFVPRIAHAPLPGQPSRSIYQPVGEADPDSPEPIYDAMALAHGNQQAGTILWLSMQEALSTDGLDGLPTYPVQQNRTALDDRRYTGVVVQYEGDGILSSHDIAFQLDAVKFQYGCFFASLERTGVAVVPAPEALGTSCPSGP